MIRGHRESLRIRADELAWALGLTPEQMWAVERGERKLSAAQWWAASWILQCKIDDLIVFEGFVPP